MSDKTQATDGTDFSCEADKTISERIAQATASKAVKEHTDEDLVAIRKHQLEELAKDPEDRTASIMRRLINL